MTIEEAKLISDLIEAKKHLHKASLKLSTSSISQSDPVINLIACISEADAQLYDILEEYFRLENGLIY